MTTKDDKKTGAPRSLDGLVGCDHDVGFTYDHEGPSIFKQSETQWNLEYVSEMPQDEHHGIVFWNYCPNCGMRLSPPNIQHEARGE